MSSRARRPRRRESDTGRQLAPVSADDLSSGSESSSGAQSAPEALRDVYVTYADGSREYVHAPTAHRIISYSRRMSFMHFDVETGGKRTSVPANMVRIGCCLVNVQLGSDFHSITVVDRMGFTFPFYKWLFNPTTLKTFWEQGGNSTKLNEYETEARLKWPEFYRICDSYFGDDVHKDSASLIHSAEFTRVYAESMRAAMTSFAAWYDHHNSMYSPTSVSDNPANDFLWINYLLDHFLGRDPLGFVESGDRSQFHHHALCSRSICISYLSSIDGHLINGHLSDRRVDIFKRMESRLPVSLPEQIRYTHVPEDDATHRAVLASYVLTLNMGGFWNDKAQTHIYMYPKMFS
ncbi:MAG: hypothetical protein JSS82_03560 [Bacteroidetes bacterium]|nr:hypothetical protein [Bacteroidota bacterium]